MLKEINFALLFSSFAIQFTNSILLSMQARVQAEKTEKENNEKQAHKKVFAAAAAISSLFQLRCNVGNKRNDNEKTFRFNDLCFICFPLGLPT
jgi:hypothetical protein